MAGCTGIEADVWLTEDGQDLLVGHDRAALAPQKTLKDMYLDPLMGILDLRNPNMVEGRDAREQAAGVFKSRGQTPVVLMIDVKENATAIWNIVLEQIESFRRNGYLRRYENGTVWPGPLVVVGSGELQLDTLTASRYKDVPYYGYHDTFLDAPLGDLCEETAMRWTETYNTSNSYYASVAFEEAFGSARTGFSGKQLRTLRTQIHVTQSSGLYSRYWDTPQWPINYRDYVWDTLTREGVGMLNVDDVDSAAKQSWTQDYPRSVGGMILVTCVLLFLVLCLVGYGVLKNRVASALLARHTVF